MFIVEQGGIVKVLQPDATSPTIFLDITHRVLSGGERGLLGLAFHPDFEFNRRFFVNYTRRTDGATVIAEYRVSSSNPNIADLDELQLLQINQPFPNHNGGMIEFGPDGFLYIFSGDGGGAPGGRSQDIEDLLGKVLRVDVDRSDGLIPYSAPSDNPYFGSIPGRDEIYAIGFRNPFRSSFDRVTGRLYVGDVGQSQREEIDIVSRGGNYGWSIFEGTLCTNYGFGPGTCTTGGYTPPVDEYGHTAGRCSIAGGYAYRGAKGTLPWGGYIFGDFCSGEIMMLEAGVQSVLLDTTANISSFGEDESGELYVVSLNGTINRIVNTAQPSPCSPSTSPSSQGFDARGGGGSVEVTTGPGCNWAAFSNVGWIVVTSGNAGIGSGQVGFSVSSSDGRGTRSGTLSVAGQVFNVTQTDVTVTLPSAPTNVSITAGPGSATVGFTAPASNGGSAVTGYTVTCTAAGQATVMATGTASPITVLGLIGEVSYSCSVAAANSAGTGAGSTAVQVTPSFDTGIVPLLMLLLD